MMELFGMIPWEIVGTWALTEVGSYFCGKTNRFKANSLGELITNVICWTMDKNHKI